MLFTIQGPDFLGSRFFRFWVQDPGPGFRSTQKGLQEKENITPIKRARASS